MLMGFMCVLALLLSVLVMGEIIYSNHRNKRNCFNKSDLEKIKRMIDVSNNGGTLDLVDFYDIPYSKMGI